MNKKALAVILTGAMAGTLLAGCGSSGSTTAASTAASDSAAASTEAAAAASTAAESTAAESSASDTSSKNLPEVSSDPITITMWDIATEDPGKSTMETAVQEFMKDYPQVTVEENHLQNDNYKQQLVVAMSSGQCPDMYVSWGGGPLTEYYNSGFVNDLSDLYNNYDHPDFFDSAIAQGTIDGKLAAIPFNGISGCCVYYNKTIFNEVGLEVPTTIDELEDCCEKLKAAGYTPFSLANGSKWTGSMYYMYLVARHSGNDEFNAAYTQENGGSFTSEAFVWASDKIQDWVKKGYFPDGVNSLSTDDGQDRQLMYDGTCAMMLHGSWQCGSMYTDNADWYTQNIGVFRFPEDAEAKANGVPQDVEVGTAIDTAFSFNCWNSDGTVDQNKLNACYILATQYINNDEYNMKKIQLENKVLNINGYDQYITDENMKTVNKIFQDASNVQLWYDQYLPASVTEVHKNCMTELFGLEKNGQEIGEEEDAAMQAALADSNS